jgi:hypothetical protein
MRLDYWRVDGKKDNLDVKYRQLLEEYDRGGLPWERTLTRVRHGQWLLAMGQNNRAREVGQAALDIARRFGMKIMERDALQLLAAAS